MEYRGREISYKYGHILVTEPDGSQWTADTVEEAKADIDEEEDGREGR